jgi:hypothetical protein
MGRFDMNLKQAKKTLKELGTTQDSDQIYPESCAEYVSGDNINMTLDGTFELQEIEAIIYWMKHPEEFK